MDVTSAAILANGLNGVDLSDGASNNAIGGAANGAGNVIAGSVNIDVVLRDAGTSGNVVAGNLIGTDATGMVSLSTNITNNTVAIYSGASGNTIGGPTSAARNVISGNAANTGVTISDGCPRQRDPGQ